LETSVCCGITQAHCGDDSRSLFARADSALYSAKAAGSNRLFVHTGTHIREQNPLAATSDAGSKPVSASTASHVVAATLTACGAHAERTVPEKADERLNAGTTS
jgi:hypothetical protein